ncbi:SecDF P1 head subdomain-containing protein [Microlunatus parietis]|uniref:Preprotein translocase subunit SecD n=1 Tax=Microlunatus parietis TaxID=682979 RepID=A0A7Y9I598_9ACTN|nr:hypothetical protein [Microlunatus parietis]NYE70535.1 preprotein translocase subunit SecD [Microlunatus parietis]
MRRYAALAILTLIMAATGCGLLPRLPGPSPTPAGLTEPLAFHQVTEYRPAPCASAGSDRTYPEPDNPQACLRLGPSRLTVHRLEQVRAEADQSGHWMILITLPADAADTLTEVTADLAAEHDPRNRMAMIIGEELISAPMVQQEISGGQLQLAGTFTREQADALVRRLGG